MISASLLHSSNIAVLLLYHRTNFAPELVWWYSAAVMLRIRFRRAGRTNDPAFRIVVTERARAARTGSIVEQVGAYNPRSKDLVLDEGRIKEWIQKGAQPTDTVKNLLIAKGVMEGKKVNVLPKKTPVKKEEPEAAAPEAAPAEAAAPAPAEEPTTETPAVEEKKEGAAETPAEAPTEAAPEEPAEKTATQETSTP